MRYLFAFLSATLLCSCNFEGGIFDSSNEEFYTDRAQYDGGETIALTLVNRDEKRVLGYNLCSSTLEELHAGKWQPVILQEDWVCTAVLYLLDPGKQASFDFDYDRPMPPGVYRFKTKVVKNGKDELVELATNEFLVR